MQIKVQLPAKVRELYMPWRYKVLHGGRGGGKSHSVAQVLLDRGTRAPLRILCAREVQNSMRDSVHRLLRDYIIRLGLQTFYEVTDTEIRGINGTVFLFSGLRQQTVESIKSYEGIDLVWVEEAHSVSKRSWDVLIPTIRKEQSEIWLTLNPDLETDETYQRFVLSQESDTWVCRMNWRDNPWMPETLDAERRRAERTLPQDDYQHIWEGEPRRVAEGAVYRHEIVDLLADGRITNVPYDTALPVHTVWDLGWNDSMTIGFVQRGPQDIRIIDYIEDSHRTLDWYVNEIEKRPFRWGTDYLPHDGSSANMQTGKSTADRLREMGRKPYVLPRDNVEEGIRAARMMFPKVYFDQEKTTRLIECLKRYKRNIPATTGEPGHPTHDEFSHGADMFRYIAMAVDMMRNSRASRKPLQPTAGSWLGA